MAGFGRCKRHDDPELDCRVCIEAETVAAIVEWLRPQWNGHYGTTGKQVAKAIERNDWKRGG